MATETGEFHTAQYPIAYAPISNPESSAGEEKENRDFSGGDRKLWTPFFLRRSVLGGFLALFVAILASLVALFVYTERQGKSLGIETPGERFYYLWTYGPTAIFMILTAGWTQVEYRSMQMMPWVLMFKGPTPAAESVFLDYMSLLNVVSLYRSLRQKHFLVFLCVAGSLLLNGLSVISTGLFELDNRQIPRAADFTVTHQFDASNWNPLASDALPFVACLGYTGQNLTPPIGVHDSYIYSPFQPVDPLMSDSSKLEANNEYEVDLDIFDMDLHCEPTRRTVNTTARTEDQMDGGTIKGEDIFDSEDGCRMTTIPDVLSLKNLGEKC